MEGAVLPAAPTQSPAVMLVTTFAIAFFLQAVALASMRDGTIGEPAVSLVSLNEVVTIGVRIRKVTIVVAVAVDARLLAPARPTIGLHMRAACDRLPYSAAARCPRDTRIGVAVPLRLLAAAVAVILTVQFPLVTPDFALKETIVVLVGVVVGGIDRLWTATLGGFAIGFATGVINGALPTDKTVFLPSAVRARHPRSSSCGGCSPGPCHRGRPGMTRRLFTWPRCWGRSC